jgi:hypothetical protein
MDQVENRVLWSKNKVEELNQSDKEKEKKPKKI